MGDKKFLLCVISSLLILIGSVSAHMVGSIIVSGECTDTLHSLSTSEIFNSGPGEFVHEFTAGSSASLVVIDYDSDGDLDYIEGSHGAVFIVTNNNGQFERKLFHIFPPDPDTGYYDDFHFGAIAVADLNNDGQQDFIVGGTSGRVRVFVNNDSRPGNPQFNNVSLVKFGQCAWGVAAADFNDDGWMDFAVSHATRPLNYSTITMFYNNGDLTFTQEDVYHLEDNYMDDLAAGEFTGDEHIDLLYTRTEYRWHRGDPWNVMGRYYVLENDGDDTFTSEKLIAERGRDVLFYFGASIYLHVQYHIRHFLGFNRINPQLAIADFDDDGSLDFVVGDNNGMIELFLNDGQGDFVSDSVIHRYGEYSWGLSAGDFNEDGYLDILVGALETYEDLNSACVWLKYNQLGQLHTSTKSVEYMSDTDAVSDFLFPWSSWLIHGDQRVMDEGLFRHRDCYDKLG